MGKKDVGIPMVSDAGSVMKFDADDVLKEELTKEELGSIAQMLSQQTVKVVDSPPFVVLIQKIGRMIEGLNA